MFCPSCGKANNDFARQCTSCAAELHRRVEDPIEFEGDETIGKYEAFVGPNNRDWYVSRFSRLEEGESRLGWHWPAFFITFYWLLYRKMWLYALLYLVAPFLLAIPIGAIVAAATSTPGSQALLSGLVWFGGYWLLPPMFATSIYYKHCNAKIDAVASTTPSKARQLSVLGQKGGTNMVAAVVIGVLFFVFVTGIVAAIAIPAYQQYATKAKLVHAESVGKVAAESVAAYFYEHQEIPETLADTSFSVPLPNHISDITVDPQDGSVIVTLQNTDRRVDGNTIVLSPSLDADKNVRWSCTSPEIEDSLLPQHCQGADKN